MVTVRVVVWFSQFCLQDSHMWHCICPEFLLLALISGSLSSLSQCWYLLMLAADSLVVFPHQHLSQWQKKKKMEVLPTPSLGLVGAATLVRELDGFIGWRSIFSGISNHEVFWVALSFSNPQIQTEFLVTWPVAVEEFTITLVAGYRDF